VKALKDDNGWQIFRQAIVSLEYLFESTRLFSELYLVLLILPGRSSSRNDSSRTLRQLDKIHPRISEKQTRKGHRRRRISGPGI